MEVAKPENIVYMEKKKKKKRKWIPYTLKMTILDILVSDVQ